MKVNHKGTDHSAYYIKYPLRCHIDLHQNISKAKIVKSAQRVPRIQRVQINNGVLYLFVCQVDPKMVLTARPDMPEFQLGPMVGLPADFQCSFQNNI
jgi:hypothetical protein